MGRVNLLIAAIALIAAAVTAGPARADGDPDFITFGAGWYDFNKRDDAGGEFRLEYRSDEEFYYLKPFAAVAGTSTGSFFVGVGVLMDIYFGRRFVVTPSFAPHFYEQGGADKDLGHELEFRSQLEFAYRFDDRSRLGLSISHYSNASIGDKNPGTETLMLNYSVPIGTLFGD